MLVSTTYEKTNLRELAALVSHAAFKRLSSSSNQSAYIRRMKKYVGWDELPHDKPNNLGDLIMYSYQILEQHYRHEYIYKNKLLSDFVLQNYALDDTILLNEFRIGQSIADTVLVNGTNKVFEIKTELDSPERLQSQLQDYFRSFTEVYVFTHKTLIEKYQKILPQNVGILAYGEDGEIVTFRESTECTAFLDCSFMMGSLRKAEYTKLIDLLIGFIPEATPAFFYSTCLEILQELPIEEVQQAYCHILKLRIDRITNLYLQENSIPSFMNFSFYQSKYTKSSYLTMMNNLNKTIL